jgi:hypothetical protein
MKKILLTLLHLLFLTILMFGQVARKETLALRIDEEIIINGLLDEMIWKKAPEAGAFVYEQPDRKDPKNVKTSVKILYDDLFLYVGFLCYDTEPEKIVFGEIGENMDIRDTDSIYILIDTFQNEDAYYCFAANVLGAKSDSLVAKDGQAINHQWNGNWKTFSQKTDFGWSVEVAIEFGCLFDKPVESSIIGLCLSRIVPRLDSIFRTGPIDPAFRIDEIKELKVLELLSARDLERRMTIVPHLIAGIEFQDKFSPGVGIDAHYLFSPQIGGLLTIFPDFATVEPDCERVNLTPFELYLPEKRDFFLEESDENQLPINLFYSKRIGDIYGGTKFDGNFETYEFSLLSSQTKKDKDANEDSANYSVFRFRKKNRTNSFSIGFTAANKFTGNKNRGNAGVDAHIDLTEKWRLSGQLAMSYGDYKKNNVAFFIGPSYDSKTFHIHLHYKQIDNFFADNANHVGFIPDDNRRELDSAVNKTFPFSRGLLERIRYVSNYNIYWGMDKTLRSWQIDEGFFFDLRNAKFTISAVHTMEYKLNEYLPEPKNVYNPEIGQWEKFYTKNFRNDRTRVCSAFFNDEWQQFSLALTFGNNYGSKFHMFTISKKFAVTENIFSEYDFHRIRYASESLHNSLFIHVFKLTILLNKNLRGSFFYQANSDIRKSNFYVACVYTFKPPNGTIQFVYQKGRGDFGEKGTQGDSLMIKIGYLF